MIKAALFLIAVLLSPSLMAQSLQVQLIYDAVAVGTDYRYIDESGSNVLVQGTWISPEIMVINSTAEDITFYAVTMYVTDGNGRNDIVVVPLPDTLIRPGDQMILHGLYFSFPTYRADEIVKGQIQIDGNSENFPYMSSLFFIPTH